MLNCGGVKPDNMKKTAAIKPEGIPTQEWL